MIPGVPAPPAEVVLEFEGDALHLSWQSQATDLQPVDKFVVVMQATPNRDIIRSRRQAETIQTVPSLESGDSWEYETEGTSVILEFVDNSKPYTVSVCAVNEFGRKCTSPRDLVIEKDTRVQIPSPPEAVVREERKPSRGLIIAVAVVVPVMVMVLLLALLCVVIVCRCYRHRSKEYRPARTGIIQGICIHVL